MDTKIASLLLVVVLAAVAAGLIAIGWRGRLKRQAGLGQLPDVPEPLGPAGIVAEGQYVATTTAGDWLDRVAVHGLGFRGNAEMSIHPEGILFDRKGTSPLFVPAEAVTDCGSANGMAGKFVEKDGLVVLSWMLGEHELDTGFRPRRAADKQPLLEALQELISAAPQADADSGK
ncbi:PH-like domain-containing protein [Arthrobacter sp. S2(2024)]|uniref:PH-like domain-containing protein n=1 Tax=Arthrobacter sp. S2(2024) TaxID=3111911 RepID=UPI002FC98019